MSIDEDEFERDNLKAMEICGEVVEICHKRVFEPVNPISMDDLLKLMYCLREAYLMRNSYMFGDEGFPTNDEEDEPRI